MVEVECKDSWTWVLHLLIKDVGGVDVCEGITFMSDQQKCLFALKNHLNNVQVQHDHLTQGHPTQAHLTHNHLTQAHLTKVQVRQLQLHSLHHLPLLNQKFHNHLSQLEGQQDQVQNFQDPTLSLS